MINLTRMGLTLTMSLILSGIEMSLALPPPNDIPEEVLRTEIIIEGRSPVDGKPLSATQYAQIQTQLQQSPYPPQINPKTQQLIFLLKLRKFFKTIVPF